MKPIKLFIVAGEASGDVLGAKLIRALRASGKELDIHGIGGARMEKEGLRSLFPMSELSLMGFAEILPHIPNILNRLNQTVAAVEQFVPDAVITIDSPGFCFRLAKKLQGSSAKLIHYVAPTVWAYKPQRAQKVADLYDHLMVILPFEPPYFSKVGLDCTYVGHPIVEDAKGNGRTFRQNHNIPDDATVLCAMPGSRQTEIARLLPIFKETFALLKPSAVDLHVVIPTVPGVAAKVEHMAKDLPVPTIVISDPIEKLDAYAASNLALAKSGTGTMELAMANVPTVITYKVNLLSYWYIKRLVTIRYANLINIISNQEVFPEFLQNDATPETLSTALIELLNNSTARNTQHEQTENVLQQLGYGQSPTPSQKAAQVVLRLVTGG